MVHRMGSTRSRSILFVLCGLAVVGAASADFNVRLESGHGGIVRRLEPLNIDAKMSFVHISKCAGASWVHEMKLIFEHFYPQHEAGPEHGYLWQANHIRAKYNFISLKSPRHHVWSLFTECRYDGWGKKVTNHTAFPRSGTDEEDFELWLDTFVDSSGPKQEQHSYFNCYHPSNYQSRAFTCESMYAHGPCPTPMHPGLLEEDKEEFVLEPNLTRTLQSYWEFDWLGISDFHHASNCLLYERMTAPDAPSTAYTKAKDFVETECLCHDLSLPRAEGVSTGGVKEVHAVHHSEGHRDTMTTLSPQVLAKIDRLTRVDQELFAHALRVLMVEVQLLEGRLGRRVLCDEHLTVADVELAYITPNISSFYDRSRWL
eukprot:m.60925 g.60925  ORF g.60925 m.60925 type:complete len:372 (-) comp22906_c0_seq2:64-1179(-)